MKKRILICFFNDIQFSHDSLYDESDMKCYQYGNMGEVTQETRIYALPFLSSALALSTQFEYDSWGRILNIVNIPILGQP